VKSYALFLGCTIPARQPSYELSARKSLSRLDIELVDLPNMTCCAPPPVESINLEANLSAAAYNISLAEEADLDLVTLCAGCFQSFTAVWTSIGHSLLPNNRLGSLNI